MLPNVDTRPVIASYRFVRSSSLLAFCCATPSSFDKQCVLATMFSTIYMRGIVPSRPAKDGENDIVDLEKVKAICNDRQDYVRFGSLIAHAIVHSM